MTLALSSEAPFLDLLWTMLMAFFLAFFVYVLIMVFRDLFPRVDISPLAKTGWVALVLAFPIAGALAYLISQSSSMGQRRLQQQGVAQLSMDAHLHSLSGSDSYRGVRDVTRTRQAMTGPIRPA